LGGRYNVMEGRWTLDITWSAPATRTDSAAIFPSDPGAPLGQRNTTCGAVSADISADMAIAAEANRIHFAKVMPDFNTADCITGRYTASFFHQITRPVMTIPTSGAHMLPL
jgi:hypothetical protein